MLAPYKAENYNDPNGMPYGGYAKGIGIDIKWQEGPLGRDENKKDPNGAFVETVIDVARQRIAYYQNSKFNCRENAIALTKLEEALMWLDKRTQNREIRQVEGTYKV